MALFKNRPLALSCFLAVACTFLSFFLATKLLILCFILAGTAMLALLVYTLHKHPAHVWLTAFIIVCFLTLTLFRICADRVLVQNRWDEHMETTVSAEMRVREIRYVSEYETELLVETREINGERFRCAAILRAYAPLSLCEGDRFNATCSVKPLSHDGYVQGIAYTYMGEGARALLVMERDAAYTLQKSGTLSLAFRFAALRASLSYRIASACEGEAGNLLASLLLGTRTKLSDTTVRDFSRVGVSHLLALSGLHLGVLAGIFDALLLWLRCKKTTRTIVVILICFAYLALTGFHYSMLRAVIMLLFTYLAFWYKADYDSMSALCFCAAVFVLLTPTAIFNVSFRLTFLATLGILAANEIMRDLHFKIPAKRGPKRMLMRAAYAVIFSLIASLMSTLTVLPVLWLSFGEVSLMTPLANLLLIPMAPLLLFGAILVLLLPIAPIGLLVSLPARLLLYITATLAEARCVVSLEHGFVPYILIPLFLVTGVLLLLDLEKRRYVILMPIGVAALAFGICLACSQISAKDTLGVTYIGSGQNEAIVITQGTSAVLCDQSSGSLSALYAATNAAKEAGISEIDALILSHYHHDHIHALRLFCRKIKVRAVYLPHPISETELAYMQQIRAVLAELSIKTTIYHYGTTIPVFDAGSITLDRAQDAGASTHPPLAITVGKGNAAVCYHSASQALLSQSTHFHRNCHADTLLIGTHGASLANSIVLRPTGATVYICDERLASHVRVNSADKCVIGTTREDFILE